MTPPDEAHPDSSDPGTPTAHRATRPTNTVQRLRHDHGEGVISAAIAVLVMAGIGALMWIGFKSMWETTETNTNQKVEEIGK